MWCYTMYRVYLFYQYKPFLCADIAFPQRQLKIKGIHMRLQVKDNLNSFG